MKPFADMYNAYVEVYTYMLREGQMADNVLVTVSV